MKRLLCFSVIPAMLLLLFACPYEAPFPLSGADEPYPSFLKGQWIEEGTADNLNPEYYDLKDINGYSFTICDYSYSSDEEDYTRTDFTAHITPIDKDLFLNIYDAEEQRYSFYKISLMENGNIQLLPVTENITETFSSSEEMKAYFKKNRKLSFFYEEAVVMEPYPPN